MPDEGIDGELSAHDVRCNTSSVKIIKESASKSEDSPPEKSVVKERILEKIDLSKGI